MSKIGEIVSFLFSIRDNMKIYHWQTKSYSRHIASDKFVDNLSDKIDTFIETLQGTKNEVLNIDSNLTLVNINDDIAVKLLNSYKTWLTITLPKYLDPKHTDLLNLRDDMLKDVNQTLYLFTLK